jgi:hypothetical protein
MALPQAQLTIGGTIYNILVSADVTRNENGFDVATIIVNNELSQNYPANIDAGKTILLKVKDSSDGSWTTLFNGLIRFCLPNIIGQEPGETLTLKCDGTGYGLTETSCNQEYGTESRNSSYGTRITDILTDATIGIIPKYVNGILGSGSSGYTYDYSKVESIEGPINFVCSPYQPCDKLINDLCDLVTAIGAGTTPGPHWIVDTSGNFRMKLIGATQVGWTLYYGDSQANATLAQGVDFDSFNFEHQDSEANYILYYGTLRKPARDYWTEGKASSWGKTDAYITLSDETIIVKVGTYSLKVISTQAPRYCWWPSGQNAAWNFTKIGSAKNPPTFVFDYNCANPDANYIQLCTDSNNYFYHLVGDGSTVITDWQIIRKVVGPYYCEGAWNDNLKDWSKYGSPSWSNINYVGMRIVGSTATYWDDMHFEGLICRAAKDSTLIVADKLKLRTIVDQVGKDDVMTLADTGTMARLCASELFSARTKPLIAQITTPMIKDLLPGQYLHIHAKTKSDASFNIDKDMRVTNLRHHIDSKILTTTTSLTDDLTNSSARSSYKNYNTVASAIRPEYQDRSATSIKAGVVDIDVPILEVDYPS